jgi:Tol biopolymer transport system component
VRPFRLIALLSLAGLLSAFPAGSARATFPGGNGRLVFEHEEPAGDHTQVDVFSVKPDGTGLRQLTDSPDNNEFGPAWNAQGTKIAFWRTKAPFGPGSIWVMDADGSNKRRLTKNVDARDPVWNPDGNRLAYTCSTHSGDICTLRVSDGGDRQHVTSSPAGDFEPAWSPDGHYIAFTRSSEQGDPGDVFVVTVDVKVRNAVRLTHSPDYDHQVGWSPDSSKVVFERDFDRSAAIFVVNADGTNHRRLSPGQHFDLGPAYSPTGKLIAFGSDRGTDLFPDLWIMRANGTDLRRLGGSQFPESFPDWQALGA